METQTRLSRHNKIILTENIIAEKYTYVQRVIYEVLCFDVAQGQMNRAHSEPRTHQRRFASLAYKHYITGGAHIYMELK